MSKPGTPAPPTSPVPLQVAPVAAPAPAVAPVAAAPAAPGAGVPAVETVENHILEGAVNGTVDGAPISLQPMDSTAAGTPGPEFTTLPSSTPVPEPVPEPEEEIPKPTWSHSLFGCFDMDMKLLGLTMCCPCITFGANAELLGEDWMLYCLFCILPGPMCYFGPFIRNKIRKTFEIEGTDNEDVLSYLLCPCLAIVQETQQLKSAGMKPGGEAMNRG